MGRTNMLFEPIKIGTMELKNRIVSLAVGTGYGDNGIVTGRHKNFIVEQARGGTGLIINGALFPGKALPSPVLLGIGDDRYIPPLRDMVEAVHGFEAKIAGQITSAYHFARDANSPAEVAGPSEIIHTALKQPTKALTTEEIQLLIVVHQI